MSKNTNTAAKTTILETVKAYLAAIVAWFKGLKLPKITAPSYQMTAACTAVAIVGLVGCYLVAMAGVVTAAASETTAVVEKAVASGAAITMGKDGVTITAQPTVGQRLYGVGQTIHAYTVQPVVNADGATKAFVFGSAPAVVAQAPAAK